MGVPELPAIPSRGPRTVVSLILLLLLAAPASAADPPQTRHPVMPDPTAASSGSAYVPGELVVTFDPGATRHARTNALGSHGARVERNLAAPGVALVSLPPTANVRAVAASLAREPGILAAEPNYVYRISATPNDPLLGDLWGLSNDQDHDIDAPRAWDITTGSANVVVAVIDTGVDYAHPDLAANIWTNPDEPLDGADNDGNGYIDDVRGWDFVGGGGAIMDDDPMDENGHGTHVAGTIGARGNNGAGMTGVSWRVSLMPVRAADAQGRLTTIRVIESINYACQQGARVINASFGAPFYSFALDATIAGCPQALFVVAAGNERRNNDSDPEYPCALPLGNVVCVAASGRDDRLTDFSNFGASSVDLAAPGESILSATHRRVFLLDGFESGLGLWTADKVSGRSWSTTTEAAASGNASATDSAGLDYLNDSDTWIETAAPRDLSGGDRCQLDYAFRTDLARPDRLEAQGSSNGGASWKTLDSGETGDLAWTGISDGFFEWSEFIYLDGFDDVPSFDLRFRLVSDGSGRRDGAWVDDVVLHCLHDTHGTNDFIRMNGTSMATPHVSGVAALMLAAHPRTTTAELKKALLKGADRIGALKGKVATGGRLNARGALVMLEEVDPVASKPRHTLVANSTLGQATVPVRVSWQAATDAEPSSGIAEYQLQARTRVAGSWRAWQTVARTDRLSRQHQLPPGTHQFRLRARDRAGNWSAWKTGNSLALKDPQGGSAITFVRPWSSQASAAFFDGSTRHASRARSTASHSFTGRQVAWVASRGPNRGRAKVLIDGEAVATIALHAASTRNRRVVFLARWEMSGAHTIKIRVISPSGASSGSRVDFDAFLTLG